MSTKGITKRPTRVYLLRHGESVSNAFPDLPTLPDDRGDRLSELGREQAEAASEGVAGLGVTQLFHSHMRRARETAEPIGERLGLAPTEMAGVQELQEPAGYGDYTREQQLGGRWSERMYENQADRNHTLDASESFEQLVARVRQLKVAFDAMPDDEIPLLVTHGNFLRFFLFHTLLGQEFFGPHLARKMWNARTVNCGLSVFEVGERWTRLDVEARGWTCVSWMQRPWDPV